ncbi:MAG TPA: hypothetical protein VN784_01415 [Candidatus Limnocylindrales bacterium]|nr:hypothetical protein [Candidatus Limnocylindrales bacterium]
MSLRRKLLIALGIALGMAILISVIHHYQLRAATEAYIAQLKAQGEPMDLAQVIPPSVPPNQNAAPLLLKATSLLETNWNVLGSNPPPAMLMVAPGKAVIGWGQPDIRSEGGPNSWEEIATALAEENKALNLLRQITNGLILDFGLTYTNGVDKIQFSHLAPLKRAAQALSASAIYELHRGDSGLAVKNIRAMLRLADGMSHDRLVISELVRIAITQMALPVNWEFLQSTNITDDQLATLQDDWTNLDFIRGEENALATERVTGEITLAKWRKSDSVLQDYINTWFTLAEPRKRVNIFERVRLETQIFRWRYWWSYPDELQLMRGYQIFLETARVAETNYSLLTTLRKQEDKVKNLDIDTNSVGSLYFSDVNKVDLHSLMSGSVFSLSPLFNRVMRAETTKQIAVAAIALKRYQLKHGNYPPDFSSLVPEFLTKVPLDPVNGQPLRYRRSADGTFLLYSVGENGKDDGGNPGLEQGVESSSHYWQNPHALDWVWPQPATPEEVQNYYAHPPK